MIKIDLSPKPEFLRQFALVTIVGLPLLTAAVLRIAGVFAWDHLALLVAGAVALLQCTLAFAGWLHLTRVVYVLLMCVSFPIGFVVSNVLLVAIYFLVFTPIGLVFRLIGRDMMGRRLEPSRTSYWHQRPAPRPLASYFKLY
jgi:hypothetical protein